MDQETNHSKKVRRSQIWLIALTLICLIILAYGYFYSKTSTSNPTFLRVERPLNADRVTKGDMKEVEQFLKILVNQMESQRTDYMGEMNAIGWGKVLDVERIKIDKTLIESRTMVQNAKNIAVKYRQKTSILLDEAGNYVGKLKVTDSTMQAFVEGYVKGLKFSRTGLDAMWDYEIKAISEFENVFALLSAKRGKWAVRDGRILFANESDLKTFNRHLALIEEIAKKQEGIEKQSLEAANRGFDKPRE